MATALTAPLMAMLSTTLPNGMRALRVLPIVVALRELSVVTVARALLLQVGRGCCLW